MALRVSLALLFLVSFHASCRGPNCSPALIGICEQSTIENDPLSLLVGAPTETVWIYYDAGRLEQRSTLGLLCEGESFSVSKKAFSIGVDQGWLGIELPAELNAPQTCSYDGVDIELVAQRRPARLATIERISSVEPDDVDCIWVCDDVEQREIVIEGSRGLYEIRGAPVFITKGGGLRSNALIVEDGTYLFSDNVEETTWSTASVESGLEIESFTFRGIEPFYRPVETEGLYDCSSDTCYY